MSTRHAVWPWALTASALTGAVYLGFAQHTLRLGFPLDDAWIHQVYARNFAELGEWSFIPGTASAGSTAPIWSGFLSIGHWLGVSPIWGAHIAGLALLAVSGLLAARWFGLRLASRMGLAWIVGTLVVLEWHLAWASVSGMETIGLAALALLIIFLTESERITPLGSGLLVGIGLWLRPDALLLAMLPVGHQLTRARRGRIADWSRLAVGLAIPVVLYGTFQRSLSGEWWPNTFFAKQAEYSSMASIPYLVRLLAQFGVPGEWLGAPQLDSGGPLIGPLLILLPGIVIGTVKHIAERNWTRLLPLAWCLSHLAIYALRLPVTYQHGRYAMPVLPVLLVLGAEGMLGWIDLEARARSVWVITRAWLLLVVALTFAFWLLGAQAYAREVAIIESEMVETARWIDRNTSPEALIAAHDIGAIGYYADRQLVDLAGLVSPEVIPFIRDEAKLAAYLDQTGADYLVTFPGWYPDLVVGKELVFVTDGTHSPAAGGENMAVYRWD